MSNGIPGVGGFGTYTVVNSALQYILGIGKRKENDEQQLIKENFEKQLVQAKEEFSDEMEAEKLALTRAKMQVARQYKAIESKDRLELTQRRPQLLKFLKEDCPIKPDMIKALTDLADESVRVESQGGIARLNVVMLQPHSDIDKDKVNDSLEKLVEQLGGVKFINWAYKPASGNGSLLNLNVIMRDVPTLVISPRYIAADKKVYLSAALWDSNSERHPYIRPLFAMDFDHKLLREPEQQKRLSNQLIYAATMITGCARDSYMLMTHGLPPTLPTLIKKNEWLRLGFTSPECAKITRFVLNEYRSNLTSLLAQKPMNKDDKDAQQSIALLTNEASAALTTILKPLKQ
jgi:hypothetical protein